MFRLSVVLGVAVLGVGLLLADRGLSQTDKKDPPVKTKGTLPIYWKSLGLTEEQKKMVFTTHATYGDKIATLQEQVKHLKAQEKAELEKILTDEQKITLRRLILEKAPKTTTPDKTDKNGANK
jgi:hypothetical protein